MGQARKPLDAREQAAWAGLMLLLNEDQTPAITLAEACIKAYRFADAAGQAEAVPVRHIPEAVHGAAVDALDEFDQRTDQYDFIKQ